MLVARWRPIGRISGRPPLRSIKTCKLRMDEHSKADLEVKVLTPLVRAKLKDHIISEGTEEGWNSTQPTFNFGEGVHIVIRNQWGYGRYTGRAEIALLSSSRHARRENRVYKLASLDKAIARAFVLIEKIKAADTAAAAKREREKANKEAEKEELAGWSLHPALNASRQVDALYRMQMGTSYVTLEQIRALSDCLHRIMPKWRTP